jgi:hypothetical protein
MVNIPQTSGMLQQQRAWCSNLDQRVSNGGDEVAEVAEILYYDQTREIAERRARLPKFSLTIIEFFSIPAVTRG